MSQPPLLLTVGQTARLCGIGPSTVWKYLAEGKFPQPLRISSRCTRWRFEDVKAWAESGPPTINGQREEGRHDHGVEQVAPSHVGL